MVCAFPAQYLAQMRAGYTSTSKIRTCLAIGVALVGLASCAPADKNAGLSNRELITLFASDLRLRTKPVGATTGVSSREYFYAGHNYMGCGDRFIMSGKYRVVGGKICVNRPVGRQCRTIYRRGDGSYYEVVYVDPDRRLSRTYDIEIVKLRYRETCSSGGLQ